MQQVKITLALVIAVLLQWTLRNVAEPFSYVDFPLIIVVYAALQQQSAIRALLFATASGIAVDALSGGLIGANGFSKTLVVYIITEIARRVYLDNLLLRIPVIAGACILDDLVYYGVHRLLGKLPTSPLIETMAYTLLGTTIAGTIIFLIMEMSFSDRQRPKKRDMFTQRRQTRRRNPIRLGKRN